MRSMELSECISALYGYGFKIGQKVGLLTYAVATGSAFDASSTNGGYSLPAQKPLSLGLATLKQLKAIIISFPQQLGTIWTLVLAQVRVFGPKEYTLLAILASGLVYGLIKRNRLKTLIEQFFALPNVQWPAPVRDWYAALLSVVSAGALPFLAWWGWLSLITLTRYRVPFFIVTERALFAWLLYAVGNEIIKQIIKRFLLKAPSKYTAFVFVVARRLLLYVVVLSVALDTAVELGASSDSIALWRSLFELSVIVFLAYFFAHRRIVIALVPDIPSAAYRKFVAAIEQLYFGVYAFTLGTALLQWAGYRELAHFLWLRTWALAGLFLTAILVHYFLHVTLHNLLLGRAQPNQEAISFYRALEQLLEYAALIALLAFGLSMLGLSDPLMRFALRPWFTLGNQTVSLLTVVEAVTIVLGFFLCARLIRTYLEYRVYPALNIDPGVSYAVNTVIVYVMVTIGIVEACETVGLGFGTLRLFAGALGIGIGFGLQSLAQNVVSGLILIFSRALRRGDWISTGETLGMVQEVGIRATRLRTWDDVEYLVPNARLIERELINWTRSTPYVRLHVAASAGYGCDPQAVRNALLKAAAEAAHVEQFPPPEVWFVGFGDSSLNFELLVWVNLKAVERRKAESELRFAIFDAFRKEGIEIPFPQRDLHIRSADGLSTLVRTDERRAVSDIE